jgi:hypothetical protein
MNKIQAAQRNATINAHQSAMRVELARHPEIKNILKMFPPALRKEVRFSVSDYSDSATFILRMIGLESFKDKQLVKLLAKFAGDEWASQTSDYANSDTPNRDFSFNREIPWTPKPSKHTRWIEKNCGAYHIPTTFKISVMLFTYVKSDSPTCRIVVEGYEEEVVRKEIKKIVCA